jgi:hypothetical protein
MVRVVLALSVGAALAIAPASLTPADIEQATGLHGIHLVPATARGAVPGRDNYADASGKIVLWFQSFNGQLFTRAKAQPAKMMGGVQVEPKLFHAAVTGIGDEAFDSPDGAQQHALYVRKGNAAFGLISNVTSSGAPVVSMEQLKALAERVLKRS